MIVSFHDSKSHLHTWASKCSHFSWTSYAQRHKHAHTHIHICDTQHTDNIPFTQAYNEPLQLYKLIIPSSNTCLFLIPPSFLFKPRVPVLSFIILEPKGLAWHPLGHLLTAPVSPMSHPCLCAQGCRESKHLSWQPSLNLSHPPFPSSWFQGLLTFLPATAIAHCAA